MKIKACCGSCRYSFDIWSDGTCKCEKAHGAITHVDNLCKGYHFYLDYE